jgi:exoribonuclease R
MINIYYMSLIPLIPRSEFLNNAGKQPDVIEALEAHKALEDSLDVPQHLLAESLKESKRKMVTLRKQLQADREQLNSLHDAFAPGIEKFINSLNEDQKALYNTFTQKVDASIEHHLVRKAAIAAAQKL